MQIDLERPEDAAAIRALTTAYFQRLTFSAPAPVGVVAYHPGFHAR